MTAPKPGTVVPLTRHAAPSTWSRWDRKTLDERLRRRGTSIQELSDVRELLGMPRLSAATPEDRETAHELEATPAVLAAFAEVRRQRADLLEGLKGMGPGVVLEARRLLGLRDPFTLRLGELRGLYAQCRVLEIQAESARVFPAPVAWVEVEARMPWDPA